MKTTVEKRKPNGIVDYFALAFTTWGVGYGPIAPGTWGSAVGVLIYLGIADWIEIVIAVSPWIKACFVTFIAGVPSYLLPLQLIWVP